MLKSAALLCACALTLSGSLLAADPPRPSAEAGRFVVVAAGEHVVKVNTQTGESWVLDMEKPNGLNVMGTPPRWRLIADEGKATAPAKETARADRPAR